MPSRDPMTSPFAARVGLGTLLRPRLWGVVGITASILLVAAPVAGQEGCVFGDEGNDVLRQVTLTGGASIYYITRPHLVCEDGVQIWADSATAFTSDNQAQLFGSVRYVDRARELRSDQARYFSDVGRLQASGNLFVRDRDEGAVVENGDLVYLRVTGFRPEETMTVTTGEDGVRPRATISIEREVDPNSVAEPGTDEYVVEGDRIVLQGGDLHSDGDVRLEYDSLLAFSDTLDFEEGTRRLRLAGAARVETEAYDLVGRVVEMRQPGPGRRQIHATDDAVLTGDDLVLTAPRIVLFAGEDRVERLVALRAARPDSANQGGEAPDARAVQPPLREGVDEASPEEPRRPHAVASDFEITADSLEVIAPHEVLERLFAAGRARSVSHARDTVNAEALPELARSDWLEGDTILVTFVPSPAAEPDSAAVPDSARANPTEGVDREGQRSEARIDRIEAWGAARSLYRMAPSAGAPEDGPPAVHYVVGDRITIVMQEGELDRMEVEGQAAGVHFEPFGGPPETPAEPVPPDTSSARGLEDAFRAPGSVQPAKPSRNVSSGRGPFDASMFVAPVTAAWRNDP